MATLKYKIDEEWIDLVDVDTLYPVGALYISYINTSPATLFGGTWTSMSGRFLYPSTSDSGQQGGGQHQHEWGLAFRGFFGTISTQYDADLIKPVRYDSSNNKTWVPAQVGIQFQNDKRNWGLDPDLYGMVTTTSMDAYGTTSNVESLPPYITVFVWRRTA